MHSFVAPNPKNLDAKTERTYYCYLLFLVRMDNNYGVPRTDCTFLGSFVDCSVEWKGSSEVEN